MTENDEITKFQSFSERTLKYGRNLMAAAVPIIVFDFVPMIKLEGPRPLNFKIEAGGEIWIWRILLVLLVYYGIRFFGLAIPDFDAWRRSFGGYWPEMQNNLDRNIKEEERKKTAAACRNIEKRYLDRYEKEYKQAMSIRRSTHSQLTEYIWRRAYFWLVDAGLPTFLFGLALWSASAAYLLISFCQYPLEYFSFCTPRVAWNFSGRNARRFI